MIAERPSMYDTVCILCTGSLTSTNCSVEKPLKTGRKFLHTQIDASSENFQSANAGQQITLSGLALALNENCLMANVRMRVCNITIAKRKSLRKNSKVLSGMRLTEGKLQ